MKSTERPAEAATRVAGQALADSSVAQILAVAITGIGLVWLTGFAEAEALHAAAHDGRHAISFPCH